MESTDLWRSWVSKAGYPRSSRVSSAEAAPSTVSDKEVWGHLRLWDSLSLVVGWTNYKLFLQTAHVTDGQDETGELTLGRLPSDEQLTVALGPSGRAQKSSVAVPLSLFGITFLCRTNYCIHMFSNCDEHLSPWMHMSPRSRVWGFLR